MGSVVTIALSGLDSLGIPCNNGEGLCLRLTKQEQSHRDLTENPHKGYHHILSRSSKLTPSPFFYRSDTGPVWNVWSWCWGFPFNIPPFSGKNMSIIVIIILFWYNSLIFVWMWLNHFDKCLKFMVLLTLDDLIKAASCYPKTRQSTMSVNMCKALCVWMSESVYRYSTSCLGPAGWSKASDICLAAHTHPHKESGCAMWKLLNSWAKSNQRDKGGTQNN